MNITRKIITFALLLILSLGAVVAQSEGVTTSPLTKSEIRKIHRDSVLANKKVWASIIGGPSYTPEASVGVGGGVLLSFKVDPKDSVSYRSFVPMGVNFSINGTLVVAGTGTLFFNENRFRIYSLYRLRNEPTNFYGVGFDEIEGVEQGEETTLFDKTNITLLNRFVWEVKPNFYAGAVVDINFSKSRNLAELMQQNSYVNKYALQYTNIALGGVVQYDTRDDIATPNSGVLLSATAEIFSRAFGGTYNYQFVDLEYRQFQPLFGRALIGWVARTQLTYGDVPFTELPMFGSPFDLRGFYWGKYRDKSMGYGIAEFRHMLGSEEAVAQGRFISKLGYVAWVGTGTIGTTPAEWNEWKMNYGVGFRIQLQPRKNFRFDIGKGQGEDSFLFYFNMTEAF